MKTVFTLTSAESKRLIAKAVAALPELKIAWLEAYVIVAAGTTNAFVLQELQGKEGIDPGNCALGLIANGRMGLSSSHNGESPLPCVFFKGRHTDIGPKEALGKMDARTVILKGANAVDPDGNAGILLASPTGGTVGQYLGAAAGQGLRMIIPVGLEKLVPSVPRAVKALRAGERSEYGQGSPVQMVCVPDATVITELESIRILFGLSTVPVAAGGVSGCEGAVTLCVDGDSGSVRELTSFLRNEVKGEPPVRISSDGCRSLRPEEDCIYCSRDDA